MTERQRNLISRGTALLLGVVLLWAGIRIVPTTAQVSSELREMEDQRRETRVRPRPEDHRLSSATWWPAIGLIAAGAGLTAFGVLGERLVGAARK